MPRAPRPSAHPSKGDPLLHRALTDIVLGLGGQTDLHSAMETLFGAVSRILPVNAFLLAVLKGDDYSVLFETDLDDRDERVFFPVPRPLRSQASHVAEKLRRRRFLLIHRTEEDLRRLRQRGAAPPGPGDPWQMTGNTARRSASLLFVPIRHGPMFLGMISAQSYTLNAYRPEHVARLRTIADYVAYAVLQIGRLHRQNLETRLTLRQIGEILGDLRKHADEGSAAVRNRTAQAKTTLNRLRESSPATSA